jgi:hypothetical protein
MCEFSLPMQQKTEVLPSDMQVKKGWCEFFVSLKQTIRRSPVRQADDQRLVEFLLLKQTN